MKYLLDIAYLGCAFHGFQVQPSARTVQGELGVAMERTLGVPCKITGCSRTDAGVHALSFAVTVEADGATVPPSKLPLAAIVHLPPDITVHSAVEVDATFHPRYDAIGKEYRYRILNRPTPDPFLVGRAWHLPRRVSEQGLSRMQAAARYLVGRHDFSSFMAAGSDVQSTVRTVTDLTVTREGDELTVCVRADGFLYHMVRIIVGTLTEVAFGRFSPEDVSDILRARDRAAAGMTAPADGLYLARVFYGLGNEGKKR